MSNSRKKLHTGVSKQGALIDGNMSIQEGALDVSMAFRDALTRAISRCKDSRYTIAAKISELTRHNVSKDMLDKYTASNRDYALYAEDLPAVCFALGSLTPAQVLMDPLGASVLSSDESDYVRLARLIKEDNERQQEIARLRAKLGIKDM